MSTKFTWIIGLIAAMALPGCGRQQESDLAAASSREGVESQLEPANAPTTPAEIQQEVTAELAGNPQTFRGDFNFTQGTRPRNREQVDCATTIRPGRVDGQFVIEGLSPDRRPRTTSGKPSRIQLLDGTRRAETYPVRREMPQFRYLVTARTKLLVGGTDTPVAKFLKRRLAGNNEIAKVTRKLRSRFITGQASREEILDLDASQVRRRQILPAFAALGAREATTIGRDTPFEGTSRRFEADLQALRGEVPFCIQGVRASRLHYAEQRQRVLFTEVSQILIHE